MPCVDAKVAYLVIWNPTNLLHHTVMESASFTLFQLFYLSLYILVFFEVKILYYLITFYIHPIRFYIHLNLNILDFALQKYLSETLFMCSLHCFITDNFFNQFSWTEFLFVILRSYALMSSLKQLHLSNVLIDLLFLSQSLYKLFWNL